MPLNPQIQNLMDQMAALNAPPIHTMTPEMVRMGIKMQLANDTNEPESVAQVVNRTIPGPAGEIPVRIYTPTGNGPFPALVFFHGGGWVICDLDTHDSSCRSLCNGAGCVVVSVDYRLAPEHKFPAAPEDCYAATQWVSGHAAEINANPGKIAIGGDSAGGNLTAVVAQMVRDQGGPRLAFQLLIYPATDFTFDGPSIHENGQDYFLTNDDMKWFMNLYLNSDADKKNPLASPLQSANLHGLPTALVITAEYDPLRDEGEAYGKRLKEAGVPVTISRYNGVIHGFFSMEPLTDKGKQAREECAQALRAVFAKQ
jgi:acetyl esterase